MDRQDAIRILDETFNADFDVNRYIKFIKELFNNFAINQKSWSVWKEYFDYIESYQLLGSYRDNSKKIIDVLIVKLKRTSSRDRARTMQRNFVAKYLGNAEKDGALIAFYGDDPQDWRFSFVKMEYNLVKDEYGKVTVAKELTPAKRYSFLVGVNEPNHTCRSQFLNLIMEEDVNPSLSDIEQAFSIDNVTKEFFTKYKELFLELEESLQKVINKDDFVKKEFEEKNISTVDFAKKLLGQIVFIYFLQKKGWLGVQKDESGRFKEWGAGPKDFMRRLFDKEIVPYDNFFNEVLEPLFYEALADDRTANHDYYSRFNCKIPFLNGGLFEPINDYDWAGTEIVLDNSIFDKILSTFDRFNFTVKEDEPLDKEVAVDPEMLGKVFENLLEVKDRKSKGAFYTPREIVHYMCQQSLINYLETNTSIERKDIEKFIQLGDFALDMIIKEQEQIKKYGRSYDIKEEYTLPKSIKDNYKEIDRLLKDIKIVDPAVGSGAFLVGMMNEIVKARSIFSIYSKEERKDYDLKREMIENCLYGVDIEPSAVQICKLRFWLSLIVDELDMRNIKPLPNLDHKIMCGNSLLEEFEGVKLFDEKLLGEVKKDYSFEIKRIEKEIAELNKEKGEIALGKSDSKSLKDIDREIKNLERKKQKIISGPKETSRNLTLDEAMQKRIRESQKKLNELKRLQKQFFNEQDRNKKRQLRVDIDKIEWELIEETLKEQGNEEAMEKLAQYKKNKSKPFFLWKLYFAEVFQRENPGFDVVIANPPYITIALGKKQNFFNRNEVDILKTKYYDVFEYKGNTYALFIKLSSSILASSGFCTFIIPNTLLLNYMCTNIRKFLLHNTSIYNLINIRDKVFEDAEIGGNLILIFKNERSQDIHKIKILEIDELERFTTTLEYNEVSQEIYLSNDDQRFYLDLASVELMNKIFNKSTRLDELANFYNGIKTGNNKKFIDDKKVDQRYREIIRGRDVQRYKIRFGNKYVLFDKKLLWSNTNEEKLTKTPKIVMRQTGDRLVGALDSNGYLTMDTTHLIFDTKIKIRFLLALLNSKILNWFHQAMTAEQGRTFAEIKIVNLKKLPIREGTAEKQTPLINIVDQILSITKDDDYLDNPDKQAKVKRLEKEIDALVYKLYELTPEEIKIVEGFGK